jgi:CHAT domain-containing protein
MRPGRTLLGVLCAALLATTGSAQNQPDDLTLEPGRAIERQLTRGEEHRYRIALTAGECVNVVVEQLGIDVIVHARDPGGALIADFQDEVRIRGHEPVEVVANANGAYTLTVHAAPGSVAPGVYAIRLIGRHPASDADRAIQESRTLRGAAARLQQAGTLDESKRQFERALQIAEGVRGPGDVYVAELLADLAANRLDARDYTGAEQLFRRALTIFNRTLGVEHPRTAMVHARLAFLDHRTGQHPEAESLLEHALAIVERTLGPDHPWVVRCLLTLANFRDDAGDLRKAEEIDLRAIAIAERTRETDSILYSDLLNNLGDVYRQKHDYAGAERLFLRSLALGENLRGPNSYYVSTAYQNLGIIERDAKRYAEAESYYQRALTIRERVLGPEHPDIAQLLNNLANIYHATGDDDRSLETHFRALRIWEANGGPYMRGTLLSVGNIARTYAARGDIEKAIVFQRRVDAIIETQLALNLAVGSERQKMALVDSISERTDRTISLHLREAPANPDAAALAALVLLQRKGRVLDAMADTLAEARKRIADPADQTLLDQLTTTAAQLSRVTLSRPEQMSSGDKRKAVADLEARKEDLEAQLSRHSAELHARMQAVTLESVQSAIPDDAVLVEFAVFRPFDPRTEGNDDAYGPPHYAAYVVRKQGPPVGRDLGPTRALDDAIDALRRALRDPASTDVKERARAVHEQVMRPLRASMGDASRLLISPDGELNLVPFEALVDEDGRYLIEQYAMSYLTSGRDLLRMQIPRLSRSNPVIVADPLFGEPAANGKQVTRQTPDGNARPTTATTATRTAIYFAPIGGTAQEARAIKNLFPEATLLTGRNATKAGLQRLDGPRLLHIATHGFFLQDVAGQKPQSAAPVGSIRAAAASDGAQNPLLRSGLALAGANVGPVQEDDGILTAMEASSLRLWGTKLVTLSACDTGVGEIRNGEGVYGLRRAFVIAGAETLVMTLWPVSDAITREPMEAYYAGLRAGFGRGDALRQAKLAMLKQKDRQHPFYWASFIQSGEWAGLDGVR